MTERFEEWTGALGPAQRSLIENFVTAYPRASEIRLEERRRLQGEAVALIKRYTNASELGPRLASVFTESDAGRSEDVERESKRWEAGLTRLVADIGSTLTSEQRRRVIRQIDSYAQDFRALSDARTAGRERAGARAGS